MSRVTESEMQFGEFPDKRFFHMENSGLHLSCGEGVKTVEFVLLEQKDKLFFVEAKKSCPNNANRYESEEKKIKFEEYYSEIVDKFVDSLQMFITMILGRNPKTEGIGEEIAAKKNYEKTRFYFILVIKLAKDIGWLAFPQAELERRLIRFRKIWGVEIRVLNEELAQKYGLVVA